MGIFLVFATRDLRTAVAATCSSFYMPTHHLAVVSYSGSAEELARRLNLGDGGGPSSLARCLSPRRALAVAGGVVAVLSAIRIFEMLS